MGWTQFRSWLKVTLPALGGLGVFISSFVDSSFVPLPLVTDLLVMELSSLHPLRMPYYAGMAALGSLGGCNVVYWLARKGGEAYYRRTHGQASSSRIRRFMQDYPVLGVFLPAVAPFPVPFKPFVIAQGIFQVPFLTFLIGTLAGRAARFFIEGYLGVRYGEAAKEFVFHQKLASLALVLVLILLVLLIRRAPIFRKPDLPQAD